VHGIILKTLKDYIVERHDRETWEAIQAKAGREGEMYVAVGHYEEEVTEGLLEAALDVTDTSMSDFMYDWGVWIIPPIVDIYGSTYIDEEWDGLELISQIENIHTMLRKRRMGQMAPPVLEIEASGDESLTIGYQSPREWCEWIPGLVEGVGNYYDEEFEIEEPQCMLEGDEQCRFHVERVSGGSADGSSKTATADD
jgi:predicted hydrocarbon binding protein